MRVRLVDERMKEWIDGVQMSSVREKRMMLSMNVNGKGEDVRFHANMGRSVTRSRDNAHLYLYSLHRRPQAVHRVWLVQACRRKSRLLLLRDGPFC